MYCLYSVATYLEPMLGKQRYIVAYLCSGVIASLVSLWWHTEPSNSAGASGAVFGLYGLFLAFLTTRHIPDSVRKSLLRSIGIFVIFNLAYGMKSGVDNAAHVGGLVSGFAIGYAYVFAIKIERAQRQKTNWLIPVILLITIAITGAYLQQHPVDKAIRASVLGELKESSYNDNEKFIQRLKEFDQIHASAIEILNDKIQTGATRAERITYDLLPKWEQATQLITATHSYDISPAAHTKASKIIAYINLRKKQSDLLRESAANPSYNAQLEIKQLAQQSEKLFSEITRQ